MTMRRGLGIVAVWTVLLSSVLVPRASGEPGDDLVGNSGFEAGTSGWGTPDGIVVRRVRDGHSGEFAAGVRNASTSPRMCLLDDEPNWILSSFEGEHVATAWVRAGVRGADLRLRLRELSDGEPIGVATSTVELRSSWRAVSVSYVPRRPGDSTLDLGLLVRRAEPGVCFHADDVEIHFGNGVPADNAAPQAQAQSDRRNVQGDRVRFHVKAMDPDGDRLMYVATGLPAGLKIGRQTGLISGTIRSGALSRGSFTTKVTVFDGWESTTQRFTWVVYRVAARLVRTVSTGGWSPASPDPTGLAWSDRTQTLFVTDSEVDETSLYAGVNVWQLAPSGSASPSGTTSVFSEEPTDVAFDDVGRRIFFSDDNNDRVFVVRLGPDDRFGTSDDTRTSFRTREFGSHDPEGLTFGNGALFVLDGEGAEVYRLEPGPNGQFDGVVSGDDIVSSFDLGAFGSVDPQGIEIDQAIGVLYVVGGARPWIAGFSLTGHRADLIDLSGSGIKKPSAIALAPASDGSGATHFYVADRWRDNDGDPGENDGRIFEFEAAPA